MAHDYREYEKACARIRAQNARLLSDFGDWLTRKGLSETTVRSHVQNCDLYVNEYLLYEDAIEAAKGTFHIGMYFGDWFIRKAVWSSENAIRNNAASLNKFYDFMQARGLVTEDAVRELRETIKESLPDWCAALRRYDNLSHDDPDEFWGAWRFPPDDDFREMLEASERVAATLLMTGDNNMAKQSVFRIGDSVVVKSGIMCPDRPSLSLAGWQGRVTELYPEEGNLEFHFDSVTLRAIPDDYITECEIEGLDWSAMVLGMDEVEPATPRDTEKEREQAYQEIEARHRWDYLADENPGISEVLADVDSESMAACLEAWEEHLEQVLQFPFEARVEELTTRGPIRVGDILMVDGFSILDESYGIIVHVRRNRERYEFPLCDLEATNPNSPNYQPLRDYVVWYANR